MWVGSAFGKFSENRFRERVRLLSVIFAAAYSVIGLRLFHLQVIRGETFSRMSESNRTQVLSLRAPRGNFYDRNGVLLVSNRPTWSLMYSGVTESGPKFSEVEERLSPLLKSFDDRWKKKLQKAFDSKQMVRLVEDVPNATAFGMRELGSLLPGARMEMEFRRGYSEGNIIGNLVGYLGEIDEKELKQKNWSKRKTGDLVGKMGLEKVLDEQLRGRDGGMVIEVDSTGRLKRVIRELKYQTGNSVYLTIDSKIQEAAYQGLQNSPTKRGAVVMIDLKTGAVLTWISLPAFDPTKPIGEQLVDPSLPFFDRVYRGSYPPGSIFKVITAITGLEKGLVNLNEEINCIGYVSLPDKQKQEKRFGCWSKHGRVSFLTAIAQSCDSYFYLLGQKIGPTDISTNARLFGLGEKAQDIFPGEDVGNVPNPIWKRKSGRGGWSTGDTFNMSIGQGFLTATPLQMALMMAAVGSKGRLFRPYVVDKIVQPNDKVTQVSTPKLWRTIELKDSTWENVFKGMRMVVHGGTGKIADIPYLDIKAKTGTAQNPHGENHAWYAGFAGYPNEDPSVAFCVFVENGGMGSGTAGPVAKRILEAAFPKRNTEQTISWAN